MTGLGSFSAIAAFNANSHPIEHQAQSQARSSVAADDACQTALTEEECGQALERAHMATERHLHAWLVTGTERHLDLAKAHIDQLIALSRIHQRSQS